MEENFEGYCMDCRQEVEIIVGRILKNKKEKKIMGRCPECSGEICRIFILELN